jgi:hypothetical protein
MVMPIVIGNRNSCCYKCQFARCARESVTTRTFPGSNPTEQPIASGLSVTRQQSAWQDK